MTSTKRCRARPNRGCTKHQAFPSRLHRRISSPSTSTTTKTMPFPGDPRQPVLSCSHRQPPRPSLVCSTSISRRRRLPWMRHYPTNFPEARSRYRCVTRVNSPVTEPSYFPKVRWRGSSSHAPPRASSLGLRMARTFLAPLVHLGHLRPERGKSDAF